MKIIISTIAVLVSLNIYAQLVVPIGSGSYASYPPAAENVSSFSEKAINVATTNTKPIPTNDWWSQVLVENFAGNLHAYPVTINPESYGCQLIFPTSWAGSDMANDNPLTIKGTGFAPAKNIAKNWNDWGLTINLQDAAKSMDITISNGSPFAWFEISGFDPTIEFGTGVSYFKSDGSALTFPFVGNKFGVLYQGKYYGIYAANNTQFTLSGNIVTIKNSTTKTFFTVATMKAKTELSYFETFAYSIIRDTKVNWDYQPDKATIDVTWSVTTENLLGGIEKRTVQGFLPHHYKNCIQKFLFNGKTYATPRGLLKCAEGNEFKFTYAFNGVLAHYPVPTVQSIPNAYDATKMKTMLDRFAPTTAYGADSYWGGKDLVNFAKYTLMAKETSNSNYTSIKSKTRKALEDWFTYTPGETDQYFARYDKWKALVGFNTSFGSEKFTDNHFHYGYHIFASALLGMVDQDFITKYGAMAKQVVKQYANWDRTDTSYPFFRTFSPWRGHSYAGGTSSWNGNNQESTSEAIQSWAGMFLLGDIMGDKAMRDAAAFGYLSETRATREYWFDVDKENLPVSYGNSMVGILFDGGVSYGTWFSADPVHIHGIQWLPYSPALNYLADYPTYLKSDFTVMAAKQKAIFPTNVDESFYGTDWGNVALMFQQIYDPALAAKKFDNFWSAAAGTIQNSIVKDVTAGQTYYYTHSHRSLGDIQLNDYTSAPNSQVYYNSFSKTYSYIGFNSNNVETIVKIFKSGIEIGSITVPAYSFFNRQSITVLAGIESDDLETNVTIYPNPTLGEVYINDNDFQKLECYDISGKLMATCNQNTFNISDLNSGIYVLKIYNSKGSYMKKVIKN